MKMSYRNKIELILSIKDRIYQMNQKIILNYDAIKIKPRKTRKFENSHFFLLFTGRGRVMEKSFIVFSMKHDTSYNNSIKDILIFIM